MLLLRANTDDLEVVTGSAADIEPHVSAMQADGSSPPVIQAIPNFGPLASITTATTTPIIDTSGITSGHTLNVTHLNFYNNHASQATTFKVQVNDGTNVTVLWNGTLLAGELLVFNENGVWLHYDASGSLYMAKATPVVYSASTASQGPGFSTDTYLTSSFIVFPGLPKVGTKYKCRFAVSKTAAGTATPIIQIRVGTAGTTGDTSRCSFTFSAGTAATDGAWVEVEGVFRSVGSGTAAVLQGTCCFTSQPTTGFTSLLKQVSTTSGGFDSTASPGTLGIGVSVNGGTSAAWTVQLVVAELENF